MRRRLGFILACAAALVFFGAACSSNDENGGGDNGDGNSVVVFVGASITEAWDFDHYFPAQDFRKVIHFDWKKSDAWAQVPPHKPKLVVVKECAAYFYTGGGTPLNEFHAEIQTMVGLIRGIDATPVLATTVPVDVGFGGCTRQQLDDIRAFNDWLRGYCGQQGIVCLDLYAAIADGQGQLPRDCHDGDGLHPNGRGYDILSPVVLPALRQAGL
jgi:hypothetical protein